MDFVFSLCSLKKLKFFVSGNKVILAAFNVLSPIIASVKE